MNLFVFVLCLGFAGWDYWTWAGYGDAVHFAEIALLGVVLTDQLCRSLRASHG